MAAKSATFKLVPKDNTGDAVLKILYKTFAVEKNVYLQILN